MRTQQGEPVRARKSREHHYSPYIEEQTRASSKNTRSRSIQQQNWQERKGGENSNKSISLEILGLGSNSREDMDVCKCIVPLWHEGTLNSRRAASPLMGLVEGVERWEALTTPRCPPSKLGWKRAKLCCHMYGAQSYG
ncbi:uncharacterized protein TNCV_5127861 [Trichonephila clavipes]|nr:uncharacterized protein TNCV_5127861 [Trichonephila clavipes]